MLARSQEVGAAATASFMKVVDEYTNSDDSEETSVEVESDPDSPDDIQNSDPIDETAAAAVEDEDEEGEDT